MVTIQDDLLDIYNALVEFSSDTITSKFPIPITVRFDEKSRVVVFEQNGKNVYLSILNYYCRDLKTLRKPTYLLPEDYDYLMSTLQGLISSGDLLADRLCISPERFGFNVYIAKNHEISNGPRIIGMVKFVSGKSWLFKFLTKRKYKLDD